MDSQVTQRMNVVVYDVKEKTGGRRVIHEEFSILSARIGKKIP